MATLACLFCTLFPCKAAATRWRWRELRCCKMVRLFQAKWSWWQWAKTLCTAVSSWLAMKRTRPRTRRFQNEHPKTYHQIVLKLRKMDPNPRIPEHSKHFNYCKFLQWYGNALLPDSFPAPFHGNAHGMVAWTALARLCVACVWFLKGVRTLELERLCRWPGLWQTQGVQDISRHFVLVLFSDCKILVLECVGISQSISHNSAWEIRGSGG